MKGKGIAVKANSLYETTDVTGQTIYVRVIRIDSNKQVQCQEVDVPEEEVLVLTPDHLVREVTEAQIEQAKTARLADLERDITDTVLGFVRIGNDLREIRDKRLYKVRNFTTFDAYCDETWHMDRRNADYLISAAKVYVNLENNCSQLPLPFNESQCREIAKLHDSERQIEAWKLAVANAGNKPPTAKQVKTVVMTNFQRRKLKAQGLASANRTPTPSTAKSKVKDTASDLAPEIVPAQAKASSATKVKAILDSQGEESAGSEDQANTDESSSSPTVIRSEDVLEMMMMVVTRIEEMEKNEVKAVEWKGTYLRDLVPWIVEGIRSLDRIRKWIKAHHAS